LDIFKGFRRLGFNVALCLWATVTMAWCSSYITQTSYLSHPLFAIYLDNVNRNRHGSTTGAYDLDAELDMRRFDGIFDKYAEGKNYLTLRAMYDVWSGQCCANDYFGWFAGGFGM
jgi:peroxygenase